MTRLLLALPLLLAAGCAAGSRPYAPVRDVAYQALGAEPFWLLTIGDDRILLRTGEQGELVLPRRLPRTRDGVRIWESGPDNLITLIVEARRGPCTAPDGAVYQDHVRVRSTSVGAPLEGCGGRMLGRGAQR